MSSTGQHACDSPQAIDTVEQLCPAEREAFGYYRARKDNCERPECECLEEWLECHSIPWRQGQLAEFLAAQRAEMERHKWIESEKAQHDVGKDAILDWIATHAENWRAAYEAKNGFVA